MTSRVELLRRTFDEAFAEPVLEGAAAPERFLAIGTGGGDHAVRLSEISGIYTGRKLVSVPSAFPELAGLIGLRGALVPVYALDLLLGEGAGEPGRWLLVTGDVGFCFNRFDGYVQAAPEDLVAGTDMRGITHETLRVAGKARPIVTLRTIVERIRLRVQALEHKE